MVNEWEGFTQTWISGAVPHVQAVYKQSDSRIAQIPLLCHLLEGMRVPGHQALRADLEQGFELLGLLTAGSGWQPRTDGKYDSGASAHDFLVENEAYIHRKLWDHRVDRHWFEMLQELAEERQKGRLEGPLAAPASWPKRCTVAAGYQQFQSLLPAPDGRRATAICFSVEQAEKNTQM